MTKCLEESRTLRVPCGVMAAAMGLRNGSLLLRCVGIPFTVAVLLSSCEAFSQSNPLEVHSRSPVAGTQNNWFSYHGDFTGRRYSELKEINPDNVHQLELKWVFHSRKVQVLGAAPVLVEGVLYLSASNDLFAIDGLTGAVLWHHTRQDAAEVQDDESAHINRGVAVLSNQLYMETNDGHLLSLDTRSGNVLWEVPFSEGYVGNGGVSAPLAIPGKVIVGASGRKGVSSSFVAAFDAADGKEVWRYTMRRNSVHKDSDSLVDSLAIRDANWMPGTYDPELNLIFEESDSEACVSDVSAEAEEVRHGGCLLALSAKTGTLKWQFQLPYDDTQTSAISAVPMLVDVPRWDAGSKEDKHSKLLVTAQGNGFLTILARATGALVIQRNLGRHSSFTGDSHLQSLGAARRSAKQDDATSPCRTEHESKSWNPPAYSEQTHRFYFLASEDCGDRTARLEAEYPPLGDQASFKSIDEVSLLAFDPSDDTWLWQNATAASDHSSSGVTMTASGLRLSGGSAQSFQAAEAETGKVLWSFPLGQSPTGPPISYSIGGKQYFAIAAGKDLFVFGLPCVTPCQQD